MMLAARLGRAGRGRWLTLALVLLAPGAPAADDGGWQASRSIRGIELEFRPGDSRLRAYRGTVAVCAELETLRRFVTDPAGFSEWIPYTAEARRLHRDERSAEYYLRTRAPWPLRDRDMVYLLTVRAPDADVIIDVEGRPDGLPPQDGAVRMEGARGEWRLRQDGERIVVSFWLEVEPGGGPAFLANRRLAATVAGALANLAERFPCSNP